MARVDTHRTTWSQLEEIMAFKNIGPVNFLVPGHTVTWTYSYGTDMGPQFACADIKARIGHRPVTSPVLVADQQAKQIQRNGNATYFVNITNKGPNVGQHNLQGGGLT
jgi:hypothetical protein